MKKVLFVILAFVTLFITGNAQENMIRVEECLVLGPVTMPIPVAEEEKTIADFAKDALSFEQFEITDLYPKVDGTPAKSTLKWTSKKAAVEGFVLEEMTSEVPSVAYLAFYVDAKRFMKPELSVTGCNPFAVYLNGKEVATNSSVSETEECETVTKSEKITLETGQHIVVLKVLLTKNLHTDNTINIALTCKTDISEVLSTTINAERTTSVEDLLYGQKISGAKVSADGRVIAVQVKQYDKEKEKSEDWINFFDTKTGKKISTVRGGFEFSQFKWLPFGNDFTFVTNDSKTKKTTIWFSSAARGDQFALVEDIEHFSSYMWAPNAEYIVYSVTKEVNKDDDSMKRYEGPYDAWPWWRKKSQLYVYNVKAGSKSQLTDYQSSASLQDISSDGTKILYSITEQTFDERPYSKTTFYFINPTTAKTEEVFTGRFVDKAIFSPDGKDLLVLGGPTLFGEVGVNVEGAKIVNDYDTQAYIYNVASGDVKAITKTFDPTISDAHWVNVNDIAFEVIDKSKVLVYKYQLMEDAFTLVDLDMEDVRSIDFDKFGNVAAFYGSSSNKPETVGILNPANMQHTTLYDPNFKRYENLKTGDVKDFNFESTNGDTIIGRVYFPPEYDADKKYPLIVYYYGGTSPVTREFEGRYPKNIWAANGYMVYVLQPSGAKGFGQEFSTRHVNDWGNTTAQEIIEGTEAFIETYPNVSKKGCIGASYGGFMTMNLITKTDMFDAAVSHAGISALTSYWGEGYWGYLYSAVATANSFPWNRKDIYVDYSPIYNADKVKTPILLVHGASDTNVPLGESKQFYTALKILGKDAELITVDGQDHHIMDPAKRTLWTKTIISYFDKYLKDQPEWFEELHGMK